MILSFLFVTYLVECLWVILEFFLTLSLVYSHILSFFVKHSRKLRVIFIVLWNHYQRNSSSLSWILINFLRVFLDFTLFPTKHKYYLIEKKPSEMKSDKLLISNVIQDHLGKYCPDTLGKLIFYIDSSLQSRLPVHLFGYYLS